MRQSIKNEIAILLRKKTVLLVWLVVGTFVLVNFCWNAVLPILVVISCGFSYFEDRVSGIDTFKIARIGTGKYFFSKITAVFFVAMSIFAIPLLLEVIIKIMLWGTA